MTQQERLEKLFDDFRNSIMKEFGNIEPVSKFKAPTLDEVVQYFDQNGYTLQAGMKAYNYYNSAGWKDGQGRPIKNWKQKMISVWFKEEHKAPVVIKKDETNVW